MAHATRLAYEHGLDVAPCGKTAHLCTPGLLIMDMDSTAIQIKFIDEIAKLARVGTQVWPRSPSGRCVVSWIAPPACASG